MRDFIFWATAAALPSWGSPASMQSCARGVVVQAHAARCRSISLCTARSVREAFGADIWRAASTLAESFGGVQPYYFASLLAPGLESNVFFRPIDKPVVALVNDADGGIAGVAQLLRTELTEPALTVSLMPLRASRFEVAFVQNLAVSGAYRRQGIARAIMAWCELRALSWPGIDEIWLAVAEDNAPALSLYADLGFERLGMRFGNILMRKTLVRGASIDAVDPGAAFGCEAALSSPAFPSQPSASQQSKGGARPPWAALAGGVASLLESALNAGFPGQLQLISLAESELRASDRVTELLGSDVSVGTLDTSESISIASGVQIVAELSGSRGRGIVTIGADRPDDDEDKENGGVRPLRLELLRVQGGDETIST